MRQNFLNLTADSRQVATLALLDPSHRRSRNYFPFRPFRYGRCIPGEHTLRNRYLRQKVPGRASVRTTGKDDPACENRSRLFLRCSFFLPPYDFFRFRLGLGQRHFPHENPAFPSDRDGNFDVATDPGLDFDFACDRSHSAEVYPTGGILASRTFEFYNYNTLAGLACGRGGPKGDSLAIGESFSSKGGPFPAFPWLDRA